MRKKIIVFTAIFISLCIVFSVLFFFSKPRGNDMYGNTANNLYNGGYVAKSGNKIYFSRVEGMFNQLACYDQTTGKVKCIKRFIAIPAAISAYNGNLYYKKENVLGADTGLYRLNPITKFSRRILPEVDRYMIYQDIIYFTKGTYESSQSSGLYLKSVDDKEEECLVKGQIQEFVVDQNKIYYTEKNRVVCYDLLNQVQQDLFSLEDCLVCSLSVNAGNLYFVVLSSDGYNSKGLYRYDLLTDTVECINTQKWLAIRYANEQFLVLEQEEGYSKLNLVSGQVQPFSFLDSFQKIHCFNSEIYCYRYTYDEGTQWELWHSDFENSICEKVS